MEQSVVASLRIHLINVIRKSINDAEPHSTTFIFRILGSWSVLEISIQPNIDTLSGETAYAGYPQVAGLGFLIGAGNPLSEIHESDFLTGIIRLMSRSDKGLEPFAIDDVAVLGIADGLAKANNLDVKNEIDAAKRWLANIVNKSIKTSLWTNRLRDLAGDLLDDRGRLRTSPDSNDICAKSLEVVLRNTWQEQYKSVPLPPKEFHVQLLRELLMTLPPAAGDLEKAAVWLRALDLLINKVAESFFSQPDREAIAQLTNVKDHLDRKAQRQAKHRLLFHFAFMALIYSALVFSIFKWGWDVMEKWTYIIGLATILVDYVYFIITLNEFSPASIYQKIIESRRQNIYAESGFDQQAFAQMVDRAKRYSKDQSNSFLKLT